MRAILPTATTIYTLTAKGAAGSAKATAIITVSPGKPQPPVITTFVAEPRTIEQGQSSILRWSVENATNVSLMDGGAGPIRSQVAAERAMSTVEPQGTRPVYPSLTQPIR